MKLLFIRHGQSQNNAKYAETNSSSGRVEDPTLTGMGEKQAESLANFFQMHGADITPLDDGIIGFGKVTRVYCSLMTRAIQTGLFISQKVGVPLIARYDLHEAGGVFKIDEETGDYIGVAGKKPDYFKKEFPGLTINEPINPDGWWNRSFEGVEERYERARSVLEYLFENHQEEDTVVMVSHRAFYNIFMRVLLSIEKNNGAWFELYNASMTGINICSEDNIGVIFNNRHDYLPGDCITI